MPASIPSVPPLEDQLFFVHIMKVGGTTLARNAAANYPPDQVFPPERDEADPVSGILQYMAVTPFAALDAEHLARLRFLSGHVPLSVAETTCPDATTIVLVRDPVERTLSYLRHCQWRHPEHAELSLEEIYEDEWFFTRFVQDHQVKLLSMTYEEATAPQLWDEPPELVEQMLADRSVFEDVARGWLAGGQAKGLMMAADRAPTERVVVDDTRLAAAIEALDRIDILALTPQLGELLEVMASRYGWRTESLRLNATEHQPVSEAFRTRIAADNAADIELYRQAEARCTRSLLS